MATETLNVSGVATKNGWTGTDADVFEALSGADGNLLINRQNEGDALLLNIDDSAVVDGDTVTSITINMRCARGSNANDSVTAQLYIGGVAQGVAQDFDSQGGALADTTLSNSGALTHTAWDVDRTAAEMDGMQVELVPTQGGMPGTVVIDFDCLDVVVTYTEAPTADPPTEWAATEGNLGQPLIHPKKDFGHPSLLGFYTPGRLRPPGPNCALQFSGDLDAVSCGDIHDFSGTTIYTVEFWMRADATQPGGSFVRAISKEISSGVGWDISLDVAGTDVQINREDSGGLDTASQGYTAGVDHHVAGVYDGTDLQAFVDGVGGTKVGSTRSLPGNAEQLTFGKPPPIGSSEYAGLLWEIRIWNYARTQQEIADYRFQRLRGDETGLLGYWPFTDCEGLTLTELVAGDHGTFGATPEWVDAPVSLANSGALEDVPFMNAGRPPFYPHLHGVGY
jgi:hypothetical protein